MREIFVSVISMSLAASIAAVAVMFIRLPMKKAPKVFSYALWAVVFLRLLCPLKFESPASLMPVRAESIASDIVYEPTARLGEDLLSMDGHDSRLAESKDLIPEDKAVGLDSARTLLLAASYIWFLGVFVIVAYSFAAYIRLKRRLYDAIIDRDSANSHSNNFRAHNIYRTDKITTAFVLGFIQPKIYVPTNCNGAQLEHILRHESVHIKRRDYLIKPIAFIAASVHWFNPLIWLSYYLMSKDMEMSCDEAVLRSSNDDLRQAYSASLVELYTRKPALLSPLAFGEGSYHNMKARIKNVLNFKKARGWTTALCFIILAVFTVGFTTDKIVTGETVIDKIETDIAEVIEVDMEKLYPLTVKSAWVDYDDSDYKWPMNASYVINTGNKNIINFEQAFLAFDKDGNPLELYWDAMNVAANGEVGSVGFGYGVDYGVVTGISPVSPKSYLHMNNQDSELGLLDDLEYLLGQTQISEDLLELINEQMDEIIIEPGETVRSDYSCLFDGWDQSAGTHNAAYIISCIKSVTFEDGSLWEYPDYEDWILNYEGRNTAPDILENYYESVFEGIAPLEDETVKINFIGSEIFAEGDAVAADFIWEGSGDVRLYFGKTPYTDEELVKVAKRQILRGATAGFNNDGDIGMSGMLYVSLSSPGEYYFYLSQEGEVRNLRGYVERESKDGFEPAIFELE